MVYKFFRGEKKKLGVFTVTRPSLSKIVCLSDTSDCKFFFLHFPKNNFKSKTDDLTSKQSFQWQSVITALIFIYRY